MKVCSKCGMEVGQFATECGHCGHKLYEQNVTPTLGLPTQPYTPSNNNAYGNNSYGTDNDGFGGIGFDDPIQSTRTYNPNQPQPYYNPGNAVARKSNRNVFILAGLFLVAAIATVIIVFMKLNVTSYKKETKVVEKWLTAAVNQDVADYAKYSYSQPMFDAMVNAYGTTDKLYSALKSITFNTVKVGNYQIRNLRIKSKDKLPQSRVDEGNKMIQQAANDPDLIFIDNMYEIEITYQLKNSYTDWLNYKENLIIYSYDGEYFVYGTNN